MIDRKCRTKFGPAFFLSGSREKLQVVAAVLRIFHPGADPLPFMAVSALPA
jgi:hypothetical protein